MGNSEVGHVNIGSGVLHYQSLPRIDKSIEDGSFFQNEALLKAVEKVKKHDSKLHIIGMLGNGGVHSHQRHLNALIDFAKEHKLKKKLFLHAILDGRDSPRDSGKIFLSDTLKYCKKKKFGKLASVCGRLTAMDRNKRWERTEKYYNVLTLGKAEKSTRDAQKTLEESYQNNVFDEEFPPTIMVDRKNQPIATISKEDAVIFFNFRADRTVQLTKAFVDPKFSKFDRQFLNSLVFITMTEYQKGLPVEIAYPQQIIENPLAKIFSDTGLKQLHLAETEKYAHITYFLNGQTEKKFAGEDRILVPSPLTDDYAKTPQMGSEQLTNELINAVNSDKYDFIAVNYANPDMVSHTGDLKATVKAIDYVDQCLQKIVPEILKKNGILFIVSDHGNAEELVNLQTGKIDKEHSVYPVPFITVSNKHQGQIIQQMQNNDLSTLTPLGILTDVAPTILSQIDMPLAPEMTGTSLL